MKQASLSYSTDQAAGSGAKLTASSTGSSVHLCGLQRITISGDSLSFVRSLLASRLAGLLKLWARYSAENTNLAPEGELGGAAASSQPLDGRGNGEGGWDQRQIGATNLARSWPATASGTPL
jgi:hypothetical protein